MVDAARALELREVLVETQTLLADEARDARAAGKLRSLAVSFDAEADSARGVSRDRFSALSESLEAIADRL